MGIPLILSLREVRHHMRYCQIKQNFPNISENVDLTTVFFNNELLDNDSSTVRSKSKYFSSSFLEKYFATHPNLLELTSSSNRIPYLPRHLRRTFSKLKIIISISTDNIPSLFLKITWESLRYPILMLFNKHFAQIWTYKYIQSTHSFPRSQSQFIFNYLIDSNRITQVTDITDHSVLLNSSLKFNKHIESICSKTSRKVGFVRRTTRRNHKC